MEGQQKSPSRKLESVKRNIDFMQEQPLNEQMAKSPNKLKDESEMLSQTISNNTDLLTSLYQHKETFVYAISGFSDQPLNSIERLDVHRGIWTEIQGALNTPRSKFTAVAVQDKIYILGGKKYDGHRTNSIEVFDPKSGLVQTLK